MANPYAKVESSQDRVNWDLAVQMANAWREYLNKNREPEERIPLVSYPYPGSPKESLSLIPPILRG